MDAITIIIALTFLLRVLIIIAPSGEGYEKGMGHSSNPSFDSRTGGRAAALSSGCRGHTLLSIFAADPSPDPDPRQTENPRAVMLYVVL